MSPVLGPREKTCLRALVVLAFLVHALGLFVTVLGPDGAVYASIAKTMAARGDFVDLFVDGKDWLDKPHFPFWVTAVFFKVFGPTTWAYKLPALLFLAVAAFYTHRLAKAWYGEAVAEWSVLILLTAEHLILSSSDVRAEPYLTAQIVAAVYHFDVAWRDRKGGHLALGSLWTALAMMTKGPFTAIPVGGAVAAHLAARGKARELLHPRAAVAVLLSLLFTFPELYCLWAQFDAHPEKTVFGRTGVSGVRFFFWDAQFGRFLNTGPIKGKGDLFFFAHTLLWAFLPWSVLMYAALARKARDLFRPAVRAEQEWLTFGGAVPILLVFSLSRFQLPHYSNLVFPFLAILTAQALLRWEGKAAVRAALVQHAIGALALAAGIALQVLYRPGLRTPWAAVPVFLLLGLSAVPSRLAVEGAARAAALRSAVLLLALNAYFLGVVSPDLMRYQSGSEAAFYLNREHPGEAVGRLDEYSRALEFYLDRAPTTVEGVGTRPLPEGAPSLWVVDPEGLERLKRAGLRTEVLREWPDYPVSRLKASFLNRATREKELGKVLLVRTSPAQ